MFSENPVSAKGALCALQLFNVAHGGALVLSPAALSL